MGRQVFVEDPVRRDINKLIENNETALGLILGQCTEQRDHVIHLAKTPTQESVESAEVRHENTQADKSRKKSKLSAIEDWDFDLVAHHAMQVTRMLLGGFYVLGVFICTSSENLQTSTISAVRQILSKIDKVLDKNDNYSKLEKMERLLIHVSCKPNKIMCKTIDISSSLASLKPADFKFLSTPTKWISFSCQLAVDVSIPLPKDNVNQNLISQIKSGLKQFCTDVTHAVATVNGSLMTDEVIMDRIESGMKQKHGKNKETIPPDLSSYEVDLLMDRIYNEKDSETVLKQDCAVAMQVRGTVYGRTYVPVKATFLEAIQYLKHDILRSLISRCEVHCEDLLVIDEEQQGDRVVVHELPCRIFAPIPNLGITLSDYIFPGETARDSLDAFKELLDISVEETDIDNTQERLPDSSDLTCPTEDGVPVAELLSPKPRTNCSFLFLGLSAAVLLFAMGIAFALFQS